jgi:putative membrane protein
MMTWIVGALGQSRYGMMDDGPGGNGWMWLWAALMVVIVVALIGLGVWAITRIPRPAAPQPHDRAREILAERLARGEITPDEYRERMQHLV